MDFFSVFGLLIAVGGIIGGQAMEGGSAIILIQAAAFFIVFGGTLGAVMVQSPYSIFILGMRLGGWAFVPPKLDMEQMIGQLVEWSNYARKDGILVLERQLDHLHDPFLQKGLHLLVDGNSPEKIREALEIELETYEQKRWQAAHVWDAAAGYSPTIGIIGAVLGLVHVMQRLGEPAALGGGIAVAFIATIYGVGLANLVYLPLAGKIKTLLTQQVKLREMQIDGLLMIASGEHPRFIETKLQGYLG